MSDVDAPLPDVFVPRPPPPEFPRTEGGEERANDVWPPAPYTPGARGEALVPLDDPGLRARILNRLEEEVTLHDPDVLVSTGEDPSGIAAVLADRTSLPLLLDPPTEIDRAHVLEDRRAAIVGETLRATPVADLVRSLEEGRASVVAIVGVAAHDGNEMEMLSNHYNVFYIIPLD